MTPGEAEAHYGTGDVRTVFNGEYVIGFFGDMVLYSSDELFLTVNGQYLGLQKLDVKVDGVPRDVRLARVSVKMRGGAFADLCDLLGVAPLSKYWQRRFTRIRARRLVEGGK